MTPQTFDEIVPVAYAIYLVISIALTIWVARALSSTGEVFLVRCFGQDEQLSAAQRALGEQHEVSRVDSKLVVATSGSVADIADMFIRLKDSGIEPSGFSKQSPTLDDVFFKILNEDKEDRYASAH